LAILTPATLITLVDKTTAFSLAEIGTVGSGYGAGDRSLSLGSTWGTDLKARNLESLVLGTADPDRIKRLFNSVDALVTASNYEVQLKNQLSGWLTALNQDCRLSGITGAYPGVVDIDTFAAYFNTGAGGPWLCLLPPDWIAVSFNVLGKNPQAVNVYSPAIVNMAQWVITGAGTGTFTPGTAVGAAYAGAAVPQLTTTGITGTGIVTVTGTNHAGVAARTWTVSVTGNAVYTLVPTVATDLLHSVTSIAAASGLTAGTAVVGAAIPAGRTNPPT